jgi:hypothetical protein
MEQLDHLLEMHESGVLDRRQLLGALLALTFPKRSGRLGPSFSGLASRRGRTITAWVGQMISEAGVDVIPTLWHLTTDVRDEENPAELWHSIQAGSDRFVRVSP